MKDSLVQSAKTGRTLPVDSSGLTGPGGGGGESPRVADSAPGDGVVVAVLKRNGANVGDGCCVSVGCGVRVAVGGGVGVRLEVGVGVTDQVEVTVAADVADVEAVGDTVAVKVAVGVVDVAIVAVAEEILVTVDVGNKGAVEEVADPVGV